MVKSHHVVYLSLMVIVGLLASLVTMVATSGSPLDSLEPAQAQSGGSMDDVIAVPVQASNDRQLLAVLAKKSGMPQVDERGTAGRPELALAVYEMEIGGQDARLRWMSTRRIEYDLQIPAHGLFRNQMPSRRGDDLSPGSVKRMVDNWVEEGEGGE